MRTSWILVFTLFGGPVVLPAADTVTLTSSSPSITVGDVFTVALELQGTTAFSTANALLKFDPAAVALSSSSTAQAKGAILTAASNGTLAKDTRTVTAINASGQVRAGVLDAGAANALSGTPSGTLVVFTFTALASGPTQISTAAYDATSEPFGIGLTTAAGAKTIPTIGSALAFTIAAVGSSPPVASIAATTTPSEPTTNGTFTVSLSSAPTAPVTVNYTVSGTATAGTDYTALGGSLVISGLSASLTVPTLDDTVIDAGETVIVTLASGSGYSVSSTAAAATLTITDNDTVTPPASAPPAGKKGGGGGCGVGGGLGLLLGVWAVSRLRRRQD